MAKPVPVVIDRVAIVVLAERFTLDAPVVVMRLPAFGREIDPPVEVKFTVPLVLMTPLPPKLRLPPDCASSTPVPAFIVPFSTMVVTASRLIVPLLAVKSLKLTAPLELTVIPGAPLLRSPVAVTLVPVAVTLPEVVLTLEEMVLVVVAFKPILPLDDDVMAPFTAIEPAELTVSEPDVVLIVLPSVTLPPEIVVTPMFPTPVLTAALSAAPPDLAFTVMSPPLVVKPAPVVTPTPFRVMLPPAVDMLPEALETILPVKLASESACKLIFNALVDVIDPFTLMLRCAFKVSVRPPTPV